VIITIIKCTNYASMVCPKPAQALCYSLGGSEEDIGVDFIDGSEMMS
jgi:hypothetical protein